MPSLPHPHPHPHLHPHPGLKLALLLCITGSAALGAFGASCSSENPAETSSGTPGGSGGGAGVGGSGGAGGTGGSMSTGTQTTFADFPGDAQIEQGLPVEIPSLFEGAQGSDTGGPCLAEPPLEALVPSNWTPLRFEWTPPAGHNVIEMRLSVDNQVNDLVIYTTQPVYTIPSAIWQQLVLHSAGLDVRVTVRSAKLENGAITEGPFVGADGVVHIAPVPAPGSIVYWTSSGGTALKGFSIGEEQVTTVLTPPMMGDGATTCIGCHTSSPDGLLAFVSRNTTGDPSRAVAARKADGTAAMPTMQEISPVAIELLTRPMQAVPALSGAHYSATDAVAITVFYDAAVTGGRGELAWTDLHATDPAAGWGLLQRAGDPRQAHSPTWWHDGSTIAYTSAPIGYSGVISMVSAEDPTMDIYTVPYNNRAGGNATPLPGASDPGYWEFYPVISPEDRLLAFSRTVPVAGGDSYDEPTAEVAVVPAKGGTAVRIEGNDPPACVNRPSPGITNSWPRWAPSVATAGGKRYYWLTFSSKRRPLSNPQLFVSGVVTSEVNGVETIERTYPAIYVTSQPPEENNHTPAWDVFQLEPPR